MLKSITEKEKFTFIYSKPTTPIVLIIVGVAGLGTGISLMGSVTPQNLTALLVGPIVAFLAAYLMLHHKQVLVIDGVKKELGEYIGKKHIEFKFEEIELADVERLKDEDAPQKEVATPQEVIQTEHEAPTEEEKAENPEETVVRTHTKAKSPRLNYHPFLKLKDGETKYFLFDNKGNGIETYKEAKLIVETINQYVGIPKMVADNLNLYQIKGKGGKGIGLMLLALLIFIGLGYWALNSMGYL